MALPRILQWTRSRTGPRGRGRRGRTTAALLCVAAAMPFAFHVRESATSTIDSDRAIAENEVAEKRWQLSGGRHAASINTVQLMLPGLVYVSADAAAAADTDADDTETMATVRVSGDSKELVECVELVPLPPNGVQLKFRKSKECATLRGHLLTSLALSRQGHVNELKASGGATVVVEDGVLLSDCEHASVHVATEGSSSVYVASTQHAINLKQLRLSVLGSGSLQFVGPESVALREHLLLEVAGSGKMAAFVGNLKTSLLKTSIGGSGNATMVSTGGSIVVDKIKTSIAGSGMATYVGDGECRVQRCSVVGSGKVEARGIRCEDASIETFGQSDVTWQVTNAMKATGWGSALVRFVNELPKAIDGKSLTIRPPKVDEAGNATPLAPALAPPKELAFNEIQAIYESKMDAVESASGLGMARRFLVNAFFGEENQKAYTIKFEESEQEHESQRQEIRDQRAKEREQKRRERHPEDD